jgi:hypothetical protein
VKLSTAFPSQLRDLVKDVRVRIEGRRSLAAAAQGLADAVYSALEESLVLTRVFATVPYGLLPAAPQAFVRRVMRDRRVESLLSPGLPVLALLGTRGVKAEWNDRAASRGHLGIPLASAAFVDEIPMIARMLSEFGLAIEGLEGEGGAPIVKSRVGTLSAMFYVADARAEVDDRGRLVISAQDFVEEQGVRTVFGFGGAYMLEKSYVAIILFAREEVDAARARELAPLSSALKAATMRLVDQDRFF